MTNRKFNTFYFFNYQEPLMRFWRVESENIVWCYLKLSESTLKVSGFQKDNSNELHVKTHRNNYLQDLNSKLNNNLNSNFIWPKAKVNTKIIIHKTTVSCLLKVLKHFFSNYIFVKDWWKPERKKEFTFSQNFYFMEMKKKKCYSQKKLNPNVYYYAITYILLPG